MAQSSKPIYAQIEFIRAGTNTTITLPAPSQRPVAPEGKIVIVMDDLGTAGTNNIAFSGPINGGTSGTSLTTNYAVALFIWSGIYWQQLGHAA